MSERDECCGEIEGRVSKQRGGAEKELEGSVDKVRENMSLDRGRVRVRSEGIPIVERGRLCRGFVASLFLI